MGQFPQDARDEHAQPPASGALNSDPESGRGPRSWDAPPPGSAFYSSQGAPHQPALRHQRGLRIAGGAVLITAVMGVGVGLGATTLGRRSAGAPPVVVPNSAPSSSGGGSGSVGGYGSGSAASGVTGRGSGGTGSSGGQGSGTDGQPAGPGTATSQLPRATISEQVGVVDINTVLGYQGAEAAGTGMVLTSNGEVLTNNHVVDGATGIKVTVVSTGATYTAKVVGTDPTQDVSVIQLQGATGLKTVGVDTAAATTAEKVTGVGNAGGVGGAPSAAAGQITATGATITATDNGGANPETLHSLLQVNADIQAGDSGGPLYNSSGQVIGMDTAAQTSTTGSTASGYAIPIGTALRVAASIESGPETSTVHLGYPAFLGVSLPSDSPASTGAVVQQVLTNGAAAQAGLAAGDRITALGSHQIATPAALKSALSTDRPGQHVKVSWTDSQGQSHTATVTLTAGPPD